MKEGWTYKKLGEVCELIMGQSPESTSYNKEGDGLPFFQGCSDFGALNPNVTTYCSAPLKIAEPLDVLMSVRAPVGTLNIANVKCCIGRGLASFRQIEGLSVYKFLYYLLKSAQPIFQQNSTGATFKAIGKSFITNYKIEYPPFIVQKQIVSELDLLSDVIEKKKTQIEELNNLAQSTFYDMFGDPVTNEKGWNLIQLGKKCDVTSFKRVLIEDVVEEGVPFIRGTELSALSKMVKGEKFDFSLFITPEHYERVKSISGVPKIGDLLIPSINADGNIWILDTEEPRYYKDGRVLWVHVNDEAYTSQSLKFIMQTLLKDTYSDMASGATFAELKLFVLRELKVPLPPLALQQEFAAKIEAIEQMKAKVRQSLKETEELFNSRMDYYFN